MAEPIKIKSSKRPNLVIDYDGKEYVLSGRIPDQVVTSRSNIPRKGLTAAERNSEIGIATIDAFMEYVMPADFREAIDLLDVSQVFEAWSEHVDLGGSNASAS